MRIFSLRGWGIPATSLAFIVAAVWAVTNDRAAILEGVKQTDVRSRVNQTDIAEIRQLVFELREERAANRVQARWIMDSLDRLQRSQGLTPPPKPDSNQ